MGFRINRGIFKVLDTATNTYREKFKIDGDTGKFVALDDAGNAVADAITTAGGTITGPFHTTHTSNTYTGASATLADYYINDTGTRLHEGGGNSLRITTPSGWVQFGAENSSWAHFNTDRSNFYFNRGMAVSGELRPYADNAYGLGNSTYKWSSIHGVTGNFTGNLVVGGTITAQEFHTEFVNQTIIQETGDVQIDGQLSFSGAATTTDQGYGITWTGFDKEGTTDFSDNASIYHTRNAEGFAGSVLVIESQNDGSDGIAFKTNASSNLKHNGNVIWTAGNDGAGSGLDADTLDGQQPSQAGGGNRIAQYASNGYLYANNWIHPANGTGLFWDSGPHFYETGGRLFSSHPIEVSDDIRIENAATHDRLEKGSAFVNPRDPWDNFHIHGEYGAMYFDSSTYFFRSTDQQTTWVTVNSHGIGIGGSPVSNYRLSLHSGGIHAGNNDINYVNQLHFNANVRFFDGSDDSYLYFKYGDAAGGGIIVRDGNDQDQVRLYGDGSGNGGLLSSSGEWGIRLVPNSATELYHNGVKKLETISNGIQIPKTGTDSYITFPAQNNDPGYIRHYESNNISRMFFSVSDDNNTTDYFGFGYSGNQDRFRIYANGQWDSQGSGTVNGNLQVNSLNGIDPDVYLNATARKIYTGINASGQQAKRYHIGRVYYCPKHWDDTWQNMDIRLVEESYSGNYVDYHLFGYYNGTDNQTIDVRVKDYRGLPSDLSRYKVVVGTHTAAGWDHSGQPVFYSDLYIEVSYYKELKVTLSMYGHSYQTTNPTSGAAITVLYDTPTATDITYANETKDTTYLGLNTKIWNSDNDGAGSGLDADTLDGLQASQFLQLTGGTVTGTITLSGGGTKLSLNNGDIVGVNQLKINDPGEGIVWNNGSSGDITLAVTDDSSDNILNLSGTGASLAVNGAKVATESWVSGQISSSSGITQSDADNRYWLRGGGWAADLVSTHGYVRQVGYNAAGGEFVLASINNKMTALTDGDYLAGERGGFYSMDNNNTFASRRGFYNDGNYATFNTPINMGGNHIHYVNEVHFSGNTRFKSSGNSNYTIHRTGSSTHGGILFDTNGTTRGYLYVNSSNHIGLLDAGGSWAVKHRNDEGTQFFTDGETLEFSVGRDLVTGNYGTVQTSTTRGGYGGYSINGEYVFMSDGTNIGLYNDIDNEWMVYMKRNAEVELMYNGSTKLETTSSGVTVTGSANVSGGISGVGSLYDLLPSGRTSYVFTATLAADTWTEVFAGNTVLGNGTWMVQITFSDSAVAGTGYTQMYSGILSWESAGSTNNAGYDAESDVVLHRSGHASNAQTLYLRTVERTSSTLALQMKVDRGLTGDATYTFKFVKVF